LGVQELSAMAVRMGDSSKKLSLSLEPVTTREKESEHTVLSLDEMTEMDSAFTTVDTAKQNLWIAESSTTQLYCNFQQTVTARLFKRTIA